MLKPPVSSICSFKESDLFSSSYKEAYAFRASSEEAEEQEAIP